MEINAADWPFFWSPGLFMVLVSVWAIVVVSLVVARRYTKKAYWKLLSTGPSAAQRVPDLLGVYDQPSEHDLLGFNAVSKAIAGLLRNKATQAPYSIVLSGGWGTGKSSVMAQIRKEISSQGSRTHWLWFNVWHFQSGQHLLSSFLGSILTRCEEKSNSFFHFNLLRRRFQNQGFWEALKTTFSFFLLLPLGLYLLYSLLHIQPLKPLSAAIDKVIHPLAVKASSGNGTLLPLLSAPFRLLGNSPELIKLAHPSLFKDKPIAGVTGKAAEGTGNPEAEGAGNPGVEGTEKLAAAGTGNDDAEGMGKPEAALWASLLAWGGAILALRKELFSKESILTNLVPMEQFKMEAATSDPGFRSKYQREFREVMRAAPPGTQFVVFIDDVDRIAGERVLELLESINFISDTAGQVDGDKQNSVKFFFILGMNIPEVVRTLSHVLDPAGRLTPELAQKKSADYLAKLIDLVVPMPDLQNCSKDQVASLLFGINTNGAAEEKESSNIMSYINSFKL